MQDKIADGPEKEKLLETAKNEAEDKPQVEIDQLPEPLAWRHILFRASANSLYLTSTMWISIAIYGLLVIFAVPVEWLEERNWEVFKSIGALAYLLMISLLFFPMSLVFQLLIAGMVAEFKRCKWQLELGGLLTAILLCIFFFWPGYFL